jgi:hypothetical protein
MFWAIAISAARPLNEHRKPSASNIVHGPLNRIGGFRDFDSPFALDCTVETGSDTLKKYSLRAGHTQESVNQFLLAISNIRIRNDERAAMGAWMPAR